MTTSATLRLVLVKTIIWSIALGSGTSGGVFAPLLIMGGALGAIVGSVMPVGEAGVWALIGMAAVMGGTMRSPLTTPSRNSSVHLPVSDGIPQDPAVGDGTVACFSNCGRYEFPKVPAAGCSDSDANCHLWKAFCLNAPASAYGKSCTTDRDCYYNGTNYGIA
jgi:hypothetical protein